MGSQTRKQRRREIRRILNETDCGMTEMPQSEWAFDERAGRLNGLTRVFKSNKRIALVYDDAMTPQWQPAIKVMCRDLQGSKLGWADLQQIKNEVFGPEAWAIQYLPPESQLVDQANMYWFYVLKATEK